MALSVEQVTGTITQVLAPGHFWVVPPVRLEWQGPVQEEVPWEIFRGQLLDRRQCRETRNFLTWKVFLWEETGRSQEPLLAVHFDVLAGQVQVVRAVCVLAWEAYAAQENVILSRQVPRWQREWVGQVVLRELSKPEELHQELTTLLFQAVVGTSRLPLTSLQTPLPAFLLGRLGYWPVAVGTAPLADWRELFSKVLPQLENEAVQARLLEVVLRSLPVEETAEAASHFGQVWTAQGRTPTQAAQLLRTLVNQVSLSPWIDLVPRLLALIQAWTAQGWWPADLEVDLLAGWIQQLSRHLTAYDLVVFHHRGANYPDALFLDALLRRYSALAVQKPEWFAGTSASAQRRRRALRQGWYLRRHYEGLPVPEVPTSPGENVRIWPFPMHVPEEHIHHPPSRPRRLFADQPLDYLSSAPVRTLLAASLDDLAHPQELRELGLGLFLDRPLGSAKHPLEPDQTVLLSYLAFSRALAQARLHELAEQAQALGLSTNWEARHQALHQLPIRGLALTAIAPAPGRIVSLADAARVAPDFLLLRTTRRTLVDFLSQYDFTSISERFCLDFLLQRQEALLVPVAVPLGEDRHLLLLYDEQMQPRLELGFARSAAYICRGGQEYLREGLQLLRYWPAGGAGPVQDLRPAKMFMLPVWAAQSSSRNEVEICTR